MYQTIVSAVDVLWHGRESLIMEAKTLVFFGTLDGVQYRNTSLQRYVNDYARPHLARVCRYTLQKNNVHVLLIEI